MNLKRVMFDAYRTRPSLKQHSGVQERSNERRFEWKFQSSWKRWDFDGICSAKNTWSNSKQVPELISVREGVAHTSRTTKMTADLYHFWLGRYYPMHFILASFWSSRRIHFEPSAKDTVRKFGERSKRNSRNGDIVWLSVHNHQCCWRLGWI